MPQDDLITTAEAAEMLGVSRRTVQRRVMRGVIPVAQKYDAGRGFFLFSRQVIELLAGRRAS